MKHSSRFLFGKDCVVQAGAGTGKTHALITQYLHLCAGATAYRRSVSPRQICALTFTEKAASEMRERLQTRVTAICKAFGSVGDRVGDRVGASPLNAVEPELVASQEELGVSALSCEGWEQVLAELSFATISTFHSFASGLLRRYASLVGIEADFALLDEDSASQMLRDSCEELLLRILDEPSFAPCVEQPGLSAAVLELVAELGFAGTGMASGEGGLVDLLCRLHKQRAEEAVPKGSLSAGYEPEAVRAEWGTLCGRLVKAFSDMAETALHNGGKTSQNAAELLDVTRALASGLAHAAAEDVSLAAPLFVRANALSKALRTPKEDEEQKRALKQGRAVAKGVWADLLALSRTLKAAPLARGLSQLLPLLAEAFAAAKRQESALDFSDLLRFARDLLQNHNAVRDELQKRYQVFLIDEFQDTNPLQAELISLLLADEGHSPGRLYIVGDRKQSIYDFRGADVAAFERLCQRMKSFGADEHTLAHSYRALPGVLSTVNGLFSHVMQRDPDILPDDGRDGPNGPEWFVTWDPARDPLSPVRDDVGVGHRQVELLRAADSSSQTPALVREAEVIALRLASLLADGVPPGQIVILLRRFTHVLRYTAALSRKHIPHYVVLGRGFFAAQEILDLSAVLRLLTDPLDAFALVAVLRSPFCGLSDEALVRLHISQALSLSVLAKTCSQPEGANTGEPGEFGQDQVLALPLDERMRVARFLGWFLPLSAAVDRFSPAELLHLVLEHSDCCAVLLQNPDDGAQRKKNLDRLIERASAYHGRLRAFVRFLRLRTDPDLSAQYGDPSDEPAAQLLSERDDAVRIMTVHQAKGLEFSTVVVAGCGFAEPNRFSPVVYDKDLGLGLSLTVDGKRQDTLPKKRVMQRRQLRAQAETARLFYVAATRAKDRLIFAGETDQKRRGTWLSRLLEWMETQKNTQEGETLLSVWVPDAERTPARSPASAQVLSHEFSDPDFARQDVFEKACRRIYGPISEPVSQVTVWTAWAAEFLSCPPRYHLLTRQPVTLSRPLHRGKTSDETASLPTFACLLSGTLPQRLLRFVDVRKRGEDLPHILSHLGLFPEHPLVSETVSLLRIFLRSRFVEEHWLEPWALSSLRMGVAYHLTRKEDCPVGLRGTLDAMWRSRDGSVCVLDVQLAPPPASLTTYFRHRKALLGWCAKQVIFPELSGNPSIVQQARVGFLFLPQLDQNPELLCISEDEIKESLCGLEMLRRRPNGIWGESKGEEF